LIVYGLGQYSFREKRNENSWAFTGAIETWHARVVRKSVAPVGQLINLKD